MSALPAAVLCDMDGTLVNTEPLWIAAQRRLAAAHGVTWTDADAHGTVGKPMPVSARQLQDSQLQDKWIALSVEEIIARLNDDVVDAIGETVPWLPGARKLLTGLAVHHVPCALVTMAYSAVACRIATGPHSRAPLAPWWPVTTLRGANHIPTASGSVRAVTSCPR